MNLRLRLIVVFFLVSVVPLGAVTYYAYTSNASAMRDAAGREAEMLAGELTERMKLVTAQLSQNFEQLMNIPRAAPLPPASMSAAGAPAAGKPADAGRRAAPRNAGPAKAEAEEATRLAGQLGEVAILLDNIEVRSFGRGRADPGGLRTGRSNDASPGSGNAPPSEPRTAASSSVDRSPEPGAASSAVPDGPISSGAQGQRVTRGRQGRAAGTPDGPPFRGRSNDDDGSRGRGSNPGNGADPEAPEDASRIRIDLGPMRREILRELFPDREQWDQLSQEERQQILTKVNDRMLGIQQGIEILREKASEQAADAIAAAATATAPRGRAPAQGASSARTDQRVGASAKGEGTVSAPIPPMPPAPPASTPPPAAPAAPLQRRTQLSGSRMDVRVTQNGEIVGQVNAEINLPNLLATVFTTTRRDRGEVPFAVDRNGGLYTPTEADRTAIAGLGTSASRPDTPPGTTVLPNWVVVTTADPTGSGLKFGIARPLGDALDDLRRSSARNAGLGLGLIGLALAAIVPLSSRLTRNLSRLSEGVDQIAKGDYRVRVNVPSKDEMGGLADAFNRMAAEIEQHQHAAVAQERLRRELELGRQIQHDMLPQTSLRLGLTEIRGVSVPANEVGGDFFNYFQTSTGKIALLVGDVSGKGVGAALLMANIQASLRTRLTLGQNLATLACELDADIGASTPGGVYSTLFVGLLDPENRTLDYVNAGHNPQFVLRAEGGLELMESTGLPIGLLAGHGYTECRVLLAHGDALFFYTDGCVEAENDSGDMFGNGRLETLLAGRPTGSCDNVLADVEREIVRFRSGREPFDDATMMVVNVG